VLTGDKLETAKSIAHSSGICRVGSITFAIEEAIKERIEKYFKFFAARITYAEHTDIFSLFVTGEVLSVIFHEKKLKKQVCTYVVFYNSIIL